MVIDPEDVTGASRYILGVDGTIDQLRRLTLTGGELRVTHDGNNLDTAVGALVADQLQIITVINDASDIVKIRVDGIEKASGEIAAMDIDKFRLMSNGITGVDGMNGDIGAIMIYNYADESIARLVEEWLAQYFGINIWDE